MTTATAVVAALVGGFLSGLLTFRRASHWCPACGLMLRCPQGHPSAPGPRR